jgi:catechol 2,3-dioxygenase
MEASSPSPAVPLDATTSLGAVKLTVSDAERTRAFYERVIGLRSSELDTGAVSVGTASGESLVELHGDAAAPALDHRAPGLFHLAILLPTRRDLADALARLVAARWPLAGASDHLVSEALYLSDPDGNGIEIYRDRPREEWPRSGGQIEMATLPLDLQALYGEAAGGSPDLEGLPDRMPDATVIGHVHLQVSDLQQAEAFYSGLLGFDVTVRGYPGALFVSAGGYHHHLGLNTWNSRGAAPARPGAIGLREFQVRLSGADELQRVVGRLAEAGVPVDRTDSAAFVRDPFGNGVRLLAAAAG